MQQPEALQAASGDPRHTPYLSAAAEERSCPCSGESPPQGLDQRPVVSITDPVNRCIPSLHLLHAKENVQCAYTLQHICTLPCCMLLKAWHEAQDCSSARMARSSNAVRLQDSSHIDARMNANILFQRAPGTLIAQSYKYVKMIQV